MNYDSWRISFQTGEQAARSAFERLAHLADENTRLRGAMAWACPSSPPDKEIAVQMALSDTSVQPGYLDGDVWRYADGMPVTVLEVMAWCHMAPAPTLPLICQE